MFEDIIMKSRFELKKEYDTTTFEKDLDSLEVSLTKDQIQSFLVYYEMLTEWNEFMNLTTITEYDEVMKKHFIDSISLCKAMNVDQNISVIDVGCGAGFPGLALKIAYPQFKVTLLDSLNKRVQFLEAVIEKLGLTDITCIHGRAEDFAKKGKLRESFDLVVSRAVANLTTLSEYCLPYAKVGGCFIPYKSEKVSEEMKNATKAIQILGGKLERQVEFDLPDTDYYRNLLVIKKEKATPGKYPRKAGLPSKEPIS